MDNLDKAILDWIKSSSLVNNKILFNYLENSDTSLSVIPMATEYSIATYIDGSRLRAYDFALQFVFDSSHSTDLTNVNAINEVRKWQTWLLAQQEIKNFPDLGRKREVLRVYPIGGNPNIQNYTEDLKTRFYFSAKIEFLEEV